MKHPKVDEKHSFRFKSCKNRESAPMNYKSFTKAMIKYSKNLLLLIIFLTTFIKGNRLNARDNTEGLQKKLLKNTEVNGIMAQVLWLKEDLLELRPDANKELIKKLKKENLLAFQIFFNTHSPSYDFTTYPMDREPYIIINKKEKIKISEWEEGQSMMPSHHRNGIMYFKKSKKDIKTLELVIFGNDLKFSWDLTK